MHERQPVAPGRTRLDRQVAGLAAKVTRQLGSQHVATYGDLDFGPAGARTGLSLLLVEALGRIDMVVVDGYGRLTANLASWERCSPTWAPSGYRRWWCGPRADRARRSDLDRWALVIGEAHSRPYTDGQPLTW